MLQSEKAELPMLFTLAGKVTDVIEQLLKAQTPMVSKLLPMVSDARFECAWKVYWPISVTPSQMTTLVISSFGEYHGRAPQSYSVMAPVPSEVLLMVRVPELRVHVRPLPQLPSAHAPVAAVSSRASVKSSFFLMLIMFEISNNVIVLFCFCRGFQLTTIRRIS